MKKGKRYTASAELVDRTKLYETNEGIQLALKTANAKFDETMELHIRLGVDGRNADQQVRGVVVLPNGTGKTVRVLVIAKGENADIATANGADFVGAEDMIAKIQGGWTDFDACVTTPDMMAQLGRVAKILGPKGLMPNPKTGTVTNNVKQAVLEAKAGRVEYRTDSYGNVHGIIGKASFSNEDLAENLNAFVKTILRAKPQTAKGTYVKSISVSATMSPSVRIDQNSFDN